MPAGGRDAWFRRLCGYLKPHPYFGVVAGRYANRIALGKFTLDGTAPQLTINNGRHHLHGGKGGFDKRNWKAQSLPPSSVRLTYMSPAREEGYLGKVTTQVTYTLNSRNELVLEYLAESDAPTIINLTNHTYWNLAREGRCAWP